LASQRSMMPSRTKKLLPRWPVTQRRHSCRSSDLRTEQEEFGHLGLATDAMSSSTSACRPCAVAPTRCRQPDIDDVSAEEHARDEVDHAAIHGLLDVHLHAGAAAEVGHQDPAPSAPGRRASPRGCAGRKTRDAMTPARYSRAVAKAKRALRVEDGVRGEVPVVRARESLPSGVRGGDNHTCGGWR
jgi:hypothetical protein